MIRKKFVGEPALGPDRRSWPGRSEELSALDTKISVPSDDPGFPAHGFDDFRRVRDLLGLGSGRLIDEHGLDWWEIMSLLLHAELETLILLQRFAQTVGRGDEVHVSRPGLHANLLRSLLAAGVNIFPVRRGSQKGGPAHYLRVSRKLSTPQIVDVFWDKYDAGYQLRGRFARRRPPSPRR